MEAVNADTLIGDRKITKITMDDKWERSLYIHGCDESKVMHFSVIESPSMKKRYRGVIIFKRVPLLQITSEGEDTERVEEKFCYLAINSSHPEPGQCFPEDYTIGAFSDENYKFVVENLQKKMARDRQRLIEFYEIETENRFRKSK